MHNWIYFIDSEDNYKKLWEVINKSDDLYLGRFVIISGSLSCKDGRIFGREGDIIAGITLITYEIETMKRLIESGSIDSTMIVPYEDISTNELDLDKNISSMIKKEIKDFEGPTAFKNYLRSVQYKDFKFEN